MKLLLRLGALLPLAVFLLLAVAPRERSAEEQFVAGEEALTSRLNDLRTRTTQAARALTETVEGEAAADFAAARAVLDRVDGAAVYDEAGDARVWAGRTFDVTEELPRDRLERG
ncbi:MAG: hypothetical protein AAGD14_17320, partial [Planctomycetota bacterium]